MNKTITVFAPIRLAQGKTEADLLAASDNFERGFASAQPGVLRRELVRKSDGTYLDIVQFRSREDMDVVMKLEMESEVCHAYFAVMDMSAEADLDIVTSLATYDKP